jgi:hypothetical protein
LPLELQEGSIMLSERMIDDAVRNCLASNPTDPAMAERLRARLTGEMQADRKRVSALDPRVAGAMADLATRQLDAEAKRIERANRPSIGGIESEHSFAFHPLTQGQAKVFRLAPTPAQDTGGFEVRTRKMNRPPKGKTENPRPRICNVPGKPMPEKRPTPNLVKLCNEASSALTIGASPTEYRALILAFRAEMRSIEIRGRKLADAGALETALPLIKQHETCEKYLHTLISRSKLPTASRIDRKPVRREDASIVLTRYNGKPARRLTFS